MIARTDPAATARPGSRARWPIFLGLAALVVVVDQLAKAWLVSFLRPGERTDVVGEYVRLVHSQNTGALFGLFRDSAPLFGIVSIGVVGVILWFHRSSGRNTLLSIALGLLLGGALGNMADRFRLGYVVDFVDLGVGSLRFYTFNVADMAVSGAILLLLLSAFLPGGDRPAAERVGSTDG
ncbi:MAG TPA: signal peptidase II [Candidatus Limnocylindrales bacterium]|nr:signal peptidase II [Candidatus Limnocylindrales bacterium]